MSAWPCVVVQWMQSLTVDFGLLISFAAENPPLDVRSPFPLLMFPLLVRILSDARIVVLCSKSSFQKGLTYVTA